jgi:hypothetical protein
MADAAPEPKNQAVSKTVMTLTMLHPTALDPSAMSQEDVAYHLGEGEFVGERTSIVTTDVADDKVVEELQALGNDGTYFETQPVPPAIPAV